MGRPPRTWSGDPTRPCTSPSTPGATASPRTPGNDGRATRSVPHRAGYILAALERCASRDRRPTAEPPGAAPAFRQPIRAFPYGKAPYFLAVVGELRVALDLHFRSGSPGTSWTGRAGASPGKLDRQTGLERA